MEYITRGIYRTEELLGATRKLRPIHRRVPIIVLSGIKSILMITIAGWSAALHIAARYMRGKSLRSLFKNMAIYYSVILCMAGGVSAHIEAQSAANKINPESVAMQAIASTPSALLTPPPLPPKQTPVAPAVAAPASVANSIQPASALSQAAPQIRQASSAGNSYYRGYCTWYAKNRRPDLPNNLGNANTWTIRARSQGIPTGSAPRAGAIGQRGMHVVYIERVNADGTVFISEMNYAGFGIVSTRTVPAGYFQYIY